MKTEKRASVAFTDGEVRADDDGLVVFPLSSEAPYLRHKGMEVLDHSEGSVDLDWLNSGNAPLLDTHSSWDLRSQIGIVRRAWLENKRLYVAVEFRSDAQSKSIEADVRKGIIRNVSVGYQVLNAQPVDEDTGEYRVDRWRPKEASFVPLPADESVGMGRSVTTKVNTMTGTAPSAPSVETAPAPLTDEQRAEAMTEAVNNITALAQEHNRSDLANDFIRGAMRNGDTPSYALFQGVMRAELPEDKPLHNTDIGLGDDEKRQFSIVRLAGAMREGASREEIEAAAFEIEATDAVAARSGTHAVPTDIMSSWDDFEMGGYNSRSTSGRQMIRAAVSTANPASTSNIQTVDHLASSFIDSLRNALVLGRLGIRMLPGLSSDIEIPGKDTNISAAWLASEDADVAESNPGFRKVGMSPHDLGAYTDITRRMIQQSTIGIEALVRSDIVTGIAEQVDLAGFYGAGSGGVPEGLANTTGIGSVTFAAATPTRDELLDMKKLIAASNQMTDPTYVMDTDMEVDLKKVKVDAGSGRFLMGNGGQLEIGYGTAITNQLTSGDIFSGVFSDMMMGLWGGLELARSTEAKFLSGGIRLRGIQTVDFGVRRLNSFVLGNDTP